MINKYENEPTAEIDKDTYFEWLNAKATAERWAATATELRALLEKQVGDAHAGTIDGIKVVTHRPTATYKEKDLIRDYPDLTEHFIKPRVVDVFDLAEFKAKYPKQAEEYRSRQFKAIEIK